MKFIETKLKGCFILEPNVIQDDRGYFMESFNENTFYKGIGQKLLLYKTISPFLQKESYEDYIIKPENMHKLN